MTFTNVFTNRDVTIELNIIKDTLKKPDAQQVISCYFFLIIVIGVYLLQSSIKLQALSILTIKNKGLVQKVSRRVDRNKFSIKSGRFNCWL